MKKKISILITAAMLASSFAAFAANDDAELLAAAESRVIAFSGAEGGGMYSKGARGAAKQEVYHVTNLNDSGAGSFRDAVSRSGRFVVFDVSGMIDLKSNVSVRSNTTILGQTAPGDGICIRGNNVKISGSDIIVRYIRFRVGAHLADGSDTRTQDGLEVTDNSERVIIDHCSVSWGTDENLSAYAVKDVTIQNCIIAEALNQSIHDKGEHSYAGIWGGVNLSVHHNLIASHKSRNPKIGTSETVSMTAGYTDDQTVVDIRNNVIYNWGDKAGYGAENGANVNIINNYYKPGPATPSNKRARIFEFSPGNKYQKGWSGAVYADGNYIDDGGAQAALVNADNWQVANGTGIYAGAGVEIYTKLDEPNTTYINDYPMNTTSAQDAYEYVLANAGARLPKLDAEDERILSDVTNGTAPTGSKGSTGLVDDPVDTVPSDAEAGAYDDRGYPVWTSETRAADYDTDKDGIPDAWETQVGLDPSNPHDALNIGHEGRTWLEFYADNMDAVLSNELKAEPQSADVNSEITFTRVSGDANELYIDGEKYAELNGELKAKLDAGVHSAYLYSAENGMSNAAYVYVTDGENALGSGQSTSRTMDGDYKLVSRIEPTNLTNEIPSYIYAGDYAIGCGYDENYDKKIYYGLKDALDISELDAEEYPLFKIENVGGFVSLYAGRSLAEWTLVGSHPSEDNTSTAGKAAADSEKPTVTKFSDTYYITDETAPDIAITNIADGDRIGFDTDVRVNVKPDGAKVSQIVVYYNGEIINSVAVDVENEQEVSVPVSFDGISSGDLKVQCIDTNLCMAEAEVSVYVSADLTPWQIADIGEVDSKTFVSVTDDYTYKINAPSGYIGGAADSFGFVYQRFTGDNRIYYRSRMQSASQFGIMLRSSLDADADMYWFGGEYNAVGTQKLTYDLKHRVKGSADGGAVYADGVLTDSAMPDGAVAVAAAYTDGRMTEVKTAKFASGRAEVGTVSGEETKIFVLKGLESLEPIEIDMAKSGGTNGQTVIDYTLDNQQPNLYFIAERAGDTLNIYRTENGATVYTTKTLLASIDCSALGDTYYMGFAAAYGDTNNDPPDAGWVSMDNNSGDNSYTWNFNYGLDWLWQMQESNVLRPSWTEESISENASGKMVLVSDDEYTSDRYVFREYQSDDSLVPEMSISFNVTGESPAMNIYFQTGESAKAYKASISDGIMTANGNELGAVDGSRWYTLNIRTDASPDGAKGYLTLTNADGETVADGVEITQVTGTEFRTQINSKKAAVTKAVYFEPVSGSEGTYYIDDVTISANEPSVKFHKVESWYTFTDYTTATKEIAGTTAANGTEPSGESIAISGGQVKTGTKKVDGISFTNAIRLKGTAQMITVPVKAGSVVSVYAGSASSSASRPLYINGEQHDLLGAVKTDYTAAEDGQVQIYAGDNIDVWGISVVSTVID